jgi:hypothetical protein
LADDLALLSAARGPKLSIAESTLTAASARGQASPPVSPWPGRSKAMVHNPSPSRSMIGRHIVRSKVSQGKNE